MIVREDIKIPIYEWGGLIPPICYYKSNLIQRRNVYDFQQDKGYDSNTNDRFN